MSNVDHSMFRHGMTGTPTWKSWSAMLARTSERSPKKRYYAGKGICVCERWKRFENFFADMGVRPEGMTLDRIDNDGDYEPGNCRWATKSEQMVNRSTTIVLTFGGESLCASAWAERTGIKYGTILYRYRRGYPVNEILSTQSFTDRAGRWREGPNPQILGVPRPRVKA